MYVSNLHTYLIACLTLVVFTISTNGLPVKVDYESVSESTPSFVPDFNNRYFLKDGKPFNYISGIFHYTRVLPHYWELRLRQMKAAGLDAIQTYVFWNVHEPKPGVYDFNGNQDIIRFIELAHKVGLLVVLRIGPYVCAEWDLGGMPSWLLTRKGINLRSRDTVYMSYVYMWLDVILPKILPLLYSKGGPIIMLQYENEYGSFGSDKVYLSNLVAYFNHIIPSEDVPLFSTDGDNYNLLLRGSLTNKLLPTIDFGINTNVANSVKELRKYSYGTPFVNSEFYVGWPDTWGGKHQTRETSAILETLDDILKANGSVCFYMFSGGTNFGFMNGAEGDTTHYSPWITSYDYDAPISEGGELTDKYYSIREFVSKYRNVTLPQPPIADDPVSYGKVGLEHYGNILNEYRDSFISYILPQPVTMEFVNQSYGYIVYEATFKSQECKENITTTFILSIQDSGHFYLNRKLVALLDRNSTNVTFQQDCSLSSQLIQIVIENMGRINYQYRAATSGDSIYNHEFKGILHLQAPEEITPWRLTPLSFIDFKYASLNRSKFDQDNTTQYCFYRGELPEKTASQIDTYVYIDLPYFYRGIAFINDFNLGRYWPVKGPQKSLYIPGVLFNTNSTNYITIFETANCTSDHVYVNLLNVPNIG